MIREVIFDIDDTMYSYTRYNEIAMEGMDRYVREHFDVPTDVFRRDYAAMQAETEARLGENNAASHSRHIWIQELLEKWGAPLFPHVLDMYWSYWGTLLKECRPEPGLLDCMKDLKARGIRIGVGSDMTTLVQYEKLKALGAAPYIDHMVTSQEAGVEKPHPDFMRLCIRKSGFAPEECLFVGDNLRKDVLGAMDVGMRAVWYNPEKKKAAGEEKNRTGYGEIRHFDELCALAARF